jgi:predicted DNA-binding protein (MmcQ/YjbR family)
MKLEWIRTTCLTFLDATEQVQWGSDLVFKIEGKMFAVLALEPARVCLAFKCTPERFAELVEVPGVIPAPYLARASWVALESDDALARREIEPLLREAYEIVLAKTPKKRVAKSPVVKKAAKRKAAKRAPAPKKSSKTKAD